jgi:hypothetical protein
VNPNYFGIIGASNTSQPGIVAGNRYGLQQGDAFAFFRMSGGQYSSSSTDWRTYGILGGYFIGGQIVCQNDYLGPAPGTPNSTATLAQYGVAAGQFTHFAFGGTQLSKAIIADATGNSFKAIQGPVNLNGQGFVQFTGSHDGLIELNEAVDIGDILVDVRIVASKNISDAVSIVTKSTQINQKSVFGIMREYPYEKYIPYTLVEEYEYEKITETPFGGDTANSEVAPTIVKDERLNPIYQSLTDTHKFVFINSVGEGLVNVCGENGNIEIGDYITTSSIPGKGMKQSDDLMRNYTVAKSRENVTFSSPTEVKLVACTYHCG